MNPLMNEARTFFYCREAGGRHVEEQVAAMSNAGFHIHPGNLVLEDVAATEPPGRRAQFRRLLRLLREGDCLVVGGLDALGRSTGEVRHMIGRFAQAGVHLYCAELGKCELTGESGRQIRETLAALATMEREQRSARATRAAGRAAPRAPRTRPSSAALRDEVASRIAAGASLAQLSREYRLPRQAIIRLCSVRFEGDDEPLLSVPAHQASRHAIEAVAMLARDEARRR